MAELVVRSPRDADELERGMDLRREVFCDEQGVSEEEELDDLDDEALHFLALDGDRVVGTCRVLLWPDHAAIGRMAVAREARRSGVGARLLQAGEEASLRHGARRVRLAAQVRAQPFYAAYGYEALGKHFMEAGIEHVRMEKALA